MKTYIVKLEIQAGEYAKSSHKLVRASSDAEARELALLGECHADLGEGAAWTEQGISDLYWEFHYRVDVCKEVSPEHIELLSSYLY